MKVLDKIASYCLIGIGAGMMGLGGWMYCDNTISFERLEEEAVNNIYVSKLEMQNYKDYADLGGIVGLIGIGILAKGIVDSL